MPEQGVEYSLSSCTFVQEHSHNFKVSSSSKLVHHVLFLFKAPNDIGLLRGYLADRFTLGVGLQARQCPFSFNGGLGV